MLSSQYKLEVDDVKSWSCEDVLTFLMASQTFSDYCSSFEQRKIDGEKWNFFI